MNALIDQWRFAAEKGFVHAYTCIGYMYEHAHGVAQSDVEAVTCYRRAAEVGSAEA